MEIELRDHIFKEHISFIVDEQEVVEVQVLQGVTRRVLEVVGIGFVGVDNWEENHVPVLLLFKVGTLS